MSPKEKQQNSCRGSQTSPGLGCYHPTSDLSTPHTAYFNMSKLAERRTLCVSPSAGVEWRLYPEFHWPHCLALQRWSKEPPVTFSDGNTFIRNTHPKSGEPNLGFLSWSLATTWILWYQARVVKVWPISHLSLFSFLWVTLFTES